jgi:hypothetical protein
LQVLAMDGVPVHTEQFADETTAPPTLDRVHHLLADLEQLHQTDKALQARLSFLVRTEQERECLQQILHQNKEEEVPNNTNVCVTFILLIIFYVLE